MARRKATRRSSCWAIDLGHQRRVDLGLAHLDDVDAPPTSVIFADALAQLLDVGALLADHHARTRRVDGDAALLVRALDDDLGDTGRLLQLLHERVADRMSSCSSLPYSPLPANQRLVPGPVDAEAQADRD